MIEAVYLMDNKPEMDLFTISIKEMKPMTIDLSLKVKEAIPLAINQIIDLVSEIQAKIL